MRESWIGAALIVGVVTVMAGSLAAQDQTAPPPNAHVDPEDQLAPSQMKQPVPAAVPSPSRPPAHPSAHPASPGLAAAETPAGAAAAAKQARAGAAHTVVACSGAFAKDSSMLRIAMVYDSRNITYTDIDVGGSKVGATVVFPKDPKRRLEVWWQNPANRIGTYLIVINGESTWTGPGGLRLGLNLEQLEKLNHKPFKLKGFDKDGVAAVSDWDDGALATIPGGCKSGVSLHADPKVPADEVTALPADHEYSSGDPAMRATKATVSEILLGY
jgi:hypothetical protein